jgi:hypothetical protein
VPLSFFGILPSHNFSTISAVFAALNVMLAVAPSVNSTVSIAT